MKVDYDKIVQIKSCGRCPLRESCEERKSFPRDNQVYYIFIVEGKETLLSLLIQNDTRGFRKWVVKKSRQFSLPPRAIEEAVVQSLRLRSVVLALRN